MNEGPSLDFIIIDELSTGQVPRGFLKDLRTQLDTIKISPWRNMRGEDYWIYRNGKPVHGVKKEFR